MFFYPITRFIKSNFTRTDEVLSHRSLLAGLSWQTKPVNSFARKHDSRLSQRYAKHAHKQTQCIVDCRRVVVKVEIY